MASTCVYDVLGQIADFEENLDLLQLKDATEADRRNEICKHLQRLEKVDFKVTDFAKDLDWLNVSESLSFTDQLKSQIVILDFFTYCCINCLHILPDLEAVEEAYPSGSGVVVIGVHSAKFLNEKVTANILSAVLRYNIKHPVVNDSNAALWQVLAISCWPTLVFVGPDGQLLYSLAGEGHRSKIMEFLDVATNYFSSRGQLQPKVLPIRLEVEKLQESSLRFPGKVSFWSERQWLLIADSGNHRIVITDTSGVVQAVVGSGCRGLKDGAGSEAEFSSPQGLVGHGDYIYVADTDNHCLRAINVGGWTVDTLAGTGVQGVDKEGGGLGTQQDLASPWDLAVGHSPTVTGECPFSNVLYIAMSGTHQIWAYFLSDTIWYKNKPVTKGTCLNFAGSGREENRNNAYPGRASFAQPSGLALSARNHLDTLYIADSESSSIRAINLSDCKVSGVVGGEKDPTNLFAFGDKDGIGTMAKLQHPLGVGLLSDGGPLVVADSYNHKIKVIDLITSSCSSLAGSGRPGDTLVPEDLGACEFNEPGGVAVSRTDQLIYVADTNNHAIKVVDFSARTISQLPIVFPKEDVKNSQNLEIADQSGLQLLPALHASPESISVSVVVPLDLHKGEHINTEAPNSWNVSGLDEMTVTMLGKLSPSDHKGRISLDAHDKQAVIMLKLPSWKSCGVYNLKVAVQVFPCLDTDVCLPAKLHVFKQCLNITQHKYLATGCSLTELHYTYRVGRSTAAEVIRRVCIAIWEIMKDACFPHLNKDEFLKISAGFEEHANFPHCIGAVDGKHIRIIKPVNSGSLYFNYKCYFSFMLLAVVDSNYCFLFVDIGSYGKNSDSTILEQSKLWRMMQDKEIDLPPPTQMPGSNDSLQYVFVGDEAFGLAMNFLRPYGGQFLAPRKRIFNYRLSRARRYVECAFGILSNKWRIFHKPLNVNVEFAIDIVKACCVLHNFVRQKCGVNFKDMLEITGLEDITDAGTGVLSGGQYAQTNRDKFTDYFNTEGQVPWQNRYA